MSCVRSSIGRGRHGPPTSRPSPARFDNTEVDRTDPRAPPRGGAARRLREFLRVLARDEDGGVRGASRGLPAAARHGLRAGRARRVQGARVVRGSRARGVGRGLLVRGAQAPEVLDLRRGIAPLLPAAEGAGGPLRAAGAAVRRHGWKPSTAWPCGTRASATSGWRTAAANRSAASLRTSTHGRKNAVAPGWTTA